MSICVQFGFKAFRHLVHTRPIEDPASMADERKTSSGAVACGCGCGLPGFQDDQLTLDQSPDNEGDYSLCECKLCGIPGEGCVVMVHEVLRFI